MTYWYYIQVITRRFDRLKIINVSNLSKSYGHVTALRNVNFDVDKGSVFGFLGPNGAGKSTTIALLFQFLRPDVGDIAIFNENIRGNHLLKRRMALLPDAELPKISGIRLLRHSARYHGLTGQALQTALTSIIKQTGISTFITRNTSKLSKGQKTRIKLANALITDPELIIADEPTSGLDPMGRRQLLAIMENLARNGKTIFFSSHVIGEVERICDKIVILNNGRVFAEGTINQITNKFSIGDNYIIYGKGIDSTYLQQHSDITHIEPLSGNRFKIQTNGDGLQTPEFMKNIVEDNSIVLYYFMKESISLENIFVNAMEV